ncbi:hypothetical protein PPERSA_03445 [Pseudocohnilembus persalinus]|uniref:RING-type domain-containing protein n=1 Tax=Pseudocohnilembus persalinus TaxID=266149 RepID=A0A0V0QBL9_PSEPJ|nr:hypothetical protein PPERSA_03445 [Pseudocohnilembus persalinus]|eukprot:KRW99644.1 hypothetical protein PPERSA_03445 [Pseudocohnilembus persalinus]
MNGPSLICSICFNEVSEILQLDCDHQLCLKCSAKIFQLPNIVKCIICEKLTYINEEAQQTLIQLSQKYRTSPLSASQQISARVSPQKQPQSNQKSSQKQKQLQQSNQSIKKTMNKQSQQQNNQSFKTQPSSLKKSQISSIKKNYYPSQQSSILTNKKQNYQSESKASTDKKYQKYRQNQQQNQQNYQQNFLQQQQQQNNIYAQNSSPSKNFQSQNETKNSEKNFFYSEKQEVSRNSPKLARQNNFTQQTIEPSPLKFETNYSSSIVGQNNYGYNSKNQANQFNQVNQDCYNNQSNQCNFGDQSLKQKQNLKSTNYYQEKSQQKIKNEKNQEKMCKYHEQQEAQLFCNSCPGSEQFCQNCSLAGLHRNHDIINLSNLKKNQQQQNQSQFLDFQNQNQAQNRFSPHVKEMIQQIRDIINKLNGKLILNSDQEKLLKKQYQELKDQLTDNFRQVQLELQLKQEQALQELDLDFQLKSQDVQNQHISYLEGLKLFEKFEKNMQVQYESISQNNEDIILEEFQQNQEEFQKIIGKVNQFNQNIGANFLSQNQFQGYQDLIKKLNLIKSSIIQSHQIENNQQHKSALNSLNISQQDKQDFQNQKKLQNQNNNISQYSYSASMSPNRSAFDKNQDNNINKSNYQDAEFQKQDDIYKQKQKYIMINSPSRNTLKSSKEQTPQKKSPQFSQSPIKYSASKINIAENKPQIQITRKQYSSFIELSQSPKYRVNLENTPLQKYQSNKKQDEKVLIPKNGLIISQNNNNNINININKNYNQSKEFEQKQENKDWYLNKVDQIKLSENKKKQQFSKICYGQSYTDKIKGCENQSYASESVKNSLQFKNQMSEKNKKQRDFIEQFEKESDFRMKRSLQNSINMSKFERSPAKRLNKNFGNTSCKNIFQQQKQANQKQLQQQSLNFNNENNTNLWKKLQNQQKNKQIHQSYREDRQKKGSSLGFLDKLGRIKSALNSERKQFII